MIRRRVDSPRCGGGVGWARLADPQANLEVGRRGPLAARLLPSRWYYGWAIVGACAALLFVSVGVGYYGLAVYLGPPAGCARLEQRRRIARDRPLLRRLRHRCGARRPADRPPRLAALDGPRPGLHRGGLDRDRLRRLALAALSRLYRARHRLGSLRRRSGQRDARALVHSSPRPRDGDRLDRGLAGRRGALAAQRHADRVGRARAGDAGDGHPDPRRRSADRLLGARLGPARAGPAA